MHELIRYALLFYLTGYYGAVAILLWRDAQIAAQWRTWPQKYERLAQREILILSLLSWFVVAIFSIALIIVPKGERWA